MSFRTSNRHRYFNTNNLWLRLDHLAEGLQRNGGLLPLPVITKPEDRGSARQEIARRFINSKRPWARPSNAFRAPAP